jgi:cation transport ATPase
MALTAAGIERMNARQEERAVKEEHVAEAENTNEAVKESYWKRRRAKRAAVNQALREKENELHQTKKERATWFSYSSVFLLALLKDSLDLAGIGSLPGVGTIVTICFSILIFLLFFLIKSNSKLLDSRFFIRMGVGMLLGSMVEGFAFGLNFLPLETLTVGIIFFMDRHFSDEAIERIMNTIHFFKKVIPGV